MGKVDKSYHQQYYAKRKEEFVNLLGGKCAKCGSKEKLQFDHIDKTSREFKIAKIMKRKKEFVLEELKKCQLLCDSCHRGKSTKEKSYGGHVKGERSNLAKLKDQEVIEIKKRLSKGDSCSNIARDYSVTRRNIWCIKNKISWAHLK